MLFGAQQQDREYHQSAARADAEKPRREAADKADTDA
jgi:hypothetical protein